MKFSKTLKKKNGRKMEDTSKTGTTQGLGRKKEKNIYEVKILSFCLIIKS